MARTLNVYYDRESVGPLIQGDGEIEGPCKNTEKSLREFCVEQLCMVLKSTANEATDVPVTG